MASCEKCWEDACMLEYSERRKSRAEYYHDLIAERKDNPCTPEQQAGMDAKECPKCGRMTIHQYAHVCMNCGFKKMKNKMEKVNFEKPGWLETLWNINPSLAERAEKDIMQQKKLLIDFYSDLKKQVGTYRIESIETERAVDVFLENSNKNVICKTGVF